MTTVFTLAGFGGLPTQLNQQLGGLVTLGNTVVPVWYNNFSPNDSGIEDGRDKLDAALHTVPADEPKIVFAHSFGAIAATRWIVDKGPTSDISPSSLKFILIGNSVRKYGGCLTGTEAVGTWAAELVGITPFVAPADVRYQVTDIARQYDGFADIPPDSALDVPGVVGNVLAGQGQIHPNYQQVDPLDPNNTSFVEGNITYVLASPTYPLPMLSGWAWDPTYLLQLDQEQRPAIEAAYDRPMPANTPNYTPPSTITPSYSLPIGPVGLNGLPDPVTDPISAYQYLDGIRQVKLAELRARPLIRLWDSAMNYIGTVASETMVDAEEMMHDTGTGDIELMESDWLVQFIKTDVRADQDLHMTIDPYPNNRNWRWRWGAKVTNVKAVRTEDGIYKVTFQCSHNREHWKHLLFGATPFSPPEVQPLKAWLMPGNTRTIVTYTGVLNLARNYDPLLSIPTNILNPGSWLKTNLLDLNPLNWPVQMQIINPITDQSRFSVIMSRWSNAHDVCDSMLKDAGCMVRAYTWLPEDKDSPHPDLAAIIGEDLARPTRACVVLAVEDKSGRTGPTGTAIDGFLQLIGVTGDDLITESLYNVVGDNVINPLTDSPVPPVVSQLLGVAPSLPSVLFRDGTYSPIASSERNTYRYKARTMMTGGKSPGWVNQLQTFGIKYALSELCQVIVASSPTGGGAGEIEPAAGFDELYQGEFDDMLLAYIRFTDPSRAISGSDYGYLEHFEQGSGSAYTVSSILTIREGLWKTRAYQAFKVSIRNNGHPNALYYDFDLGDRCLFQIDGTLYTDQVSAIKLHYDRDTPKTFDISIGDDTESESPIASLTRTAATFWNAIGMLFGSGDLF